MATAAPETLQMTPKGDIVDRVCDSLSGSRPKLLRTTCYYGIARSVVLFSVGLPVVRMVTPKVEGIANAALTKVGAPEVRALDTKIHENLDAVDVFVDDVKDQILDQVKVQKDNVTKRFKKTEHKAERVVDEKLKEAGVQ